MDSPKYTRMLLLLLFASLILSMISSCALFKKDDKSMEVQIDPDDMRFKDMDDEYYKNRK